MGDGTGCDNMTCIIILFNKSSNSKRDSEDLDKSTSDEQQPEKRARVEEETVQTDTWSTQVLILCILVTFLYLVLLQVVIIDRCTGYFGIICNQGEASNEVEAGTV